MSLETRLTFEQFLREKLIGLEDQHKTARVKIEDAEVDLERLKKQELQMRGLIDYLGRYLSEWIAYAKETQKLRQVEAIKAANKDQETKPLADKPKTSRKRTKK